MAGDRMNIPHVRRHHEQGRMADRERLKLDTPAHERGECDPRECAACSKESADDLQHDSRRER